LKYDIRQIGRSCEKYQRPFGMISRLERFCQYLLLLQLHQFPHKKVPDDPHITNLILYLQNGELKGQWTYKVCQYSIILLSLLAHLWLY
jgi:hypothetical protein